MAIGDYPTCTQCGCRLPATTWRLKECTDCTIGATRDEGR